MYLKLHIMLQQNIQNQRVSLFQATFLFMIK